MQGEEGLRPDTGTVSDMFSSLVRAAVGFVQKELGGRDKRAKRKLDKSRIENLLETSNFEDVSVDLHTFDWVSLNQDRNWWWQVQSLPVLAWFCQSYLLYEEAELREVAEYCLDVIGRWLEQEEMAGDSPLRWHDHATAFRLNNIVNFLIIASTSNSLRQLVAEKQSAIPLLVVVDNHVHWLTVEENFSKHTNHGFDQALSICTLGLFVGKSLWRHEIETAEKRLLAELEFAFTSEGVHKENSPGYHAFMMRRLEKLVALRELGATEVAVQAEKVLSGAESFLEAITLPDGTLPMVGDTQGGQKGRSSLIAKGPMIYDFSKSGYVIVKGSLRKKPYYVLFKNWHDDDLMLYVWYDGHVILGDGGLGSHEEDSVNRKELRSYCSHSVPYLEGRKCLRNHEKLAGRPEIRVEGLRIIGQSYMFGVRVDRCVDLSQVEEGRITVYDKCIDQSLPVYVNFFSEMEAYLCGSERNPVVEVRKAGRLVARLVVSEGKLSSEIATVSHSYGKFSAATRVNYRPVSHEVRCILELTNGTSSKR